MGGVDVPLVICYDTGGVIIEVRFDKVQREFNRLARNHGFRPLLLREIINLQNQGLNRTQIAQRLGINRNTVTNYLSRLRSMDGRDRWLLVVGVGLLVAGFGLLGYFLSKEQSEEVE